MLGLRNSSCSSLNLANYTTLLVALYLGGPSLPGEQPRKPPCLVTADLTSHVSSGAIMCSYVLQRLHDAAAIVA